MYILYILDLAHMNYEIESYKRDLIYRYPYLFEITWTNLNSIGLSSTHLNSHDLIESHLISQGKWENPTVPNGKGGGGRRENGKGAEHNWMCISTLHSPRACTYNMKWFPGYGGMPKGECVPKHLIHWKHLRSSWNRIGSIWKSMKTYVRCVLYIWFNRCWTNTNPPGNQIVSTRTKVTNIKVDQNLHKWKLLPHSTFGLWMEDNCLRNSFGCMCHCSVDNVEGRGTVQNRICWFIGLGPKLNSCVLIPVSWNHMCIYGSWINNDKHVGSSSVQDQQVVSILWELSLSSSHWLVLFCRLGIISADQYQESISCCLLSWTRLLASIDQVLAWYCVHWRQARVYQRVWGTWFLYQIQVCRNRYQIPCACIALLENCSSPEDWTISSLISVPLAGPWFEPPGFKHSPS